jgi:hypothetical protein
VSPGEDITELAKETQNPVSDLISVPLQNNVNFGVGPGDDVQYILLCPSPSSGFRGPWRRDRRL